MRVLILSLLFLLTGCELLEDRDAESQDITHDCYARSGDVELRCSSTASKSVEGEKASTKVKVKP